MSSAVVSQQLWYAFQIFFLSLSLSSVTRMAATGLHAAPVHANRYQSHLLQRWHKRGTQHKKKTPKMIIITNNMPEKHVQVQQQLKQLSLNVTAPDVNRSTITRKRTGNIKKPLYASPKTHLHHTCNQQVTAVVAFTIKTQRPYCKENVFYKK